MPAAAKATPVQETTLSSLPGDLSELLVRGADCTLETTKWLPDNNLNTRLQLLMLGGVSKDARAKLDSGLSYPAVPASKAAATHIIDACTRCRDLAQADSTAKALSAQQGTAAPVSEWGARGICQG